MANVLVLLSDLQCACSASGRPRTSAVVENSWVLLVDSQSTMMPATVNVNRLAAHQPNLEAGSQSTGLAPVAPLLKSYAKVEKLSISELNDFVLTAASQDIDFICSGKVTGVKLDKGWCYVSCSKCFKKLHRSVSTLTCQSCNNTNAVGVLRYRVEMSIADSTGEALFVAFDGVMAKLSTSCSLYMQAGDGVNPEEADAPPFVRDMEGRSFTFQVKVGPYNFTANHQSFTISRILSEGDREPQPDFADDGGDDDNGGDNNNGDDNNTGLVKRKMDFGGGSKSGGPSAKVKRARKA
ncbi:hypothetical protein YC2023_009380 [Brassica napus]